MPTVFFEALPDSLPLRFGQVVDEKPAVEVINFMLHTNCEQAVKIFLLGLWWGSLLIAAPQASSCT